MGKPLYNKKIVVTRNPESAGSFSEKIRILGGIPVLFPTIQIGPPVSWTVCDEAIETLESYDWIVFSSVNAFEAFHQRLNSQKRVLGNIKIAAVGQMTAAFINQNGNKVDIIPENYSAKGLIEEFDKIQLKREKILIPASDIAPPTLYEELSARGAAVKTVEVYHTGPNSDADPKLMGGLIRRDEIDCLTFFSPSAFSAFLQIIGTQLVEELKKSEVLIAAIGPTTAEEISKNDFNVDIIATKSTQDGMLSAITTYFENMNLNKEVTK